MPPVNCIQISGPNGYLLQSLKTSSDMALLFWNSRGLLPVNAPGSRIEVALGLSPIRELHDYRRHTTTGNRSHIPDAFLWCACLSRTPLFLMNHRNSPGKRDTMDAPQFIDVSTFQKPLAELAVTMALKIEREGAALLGAPLYVAIDIGALLRMSNETLNLLWFINAEETLKVGGRPIFSIASLPLVRTLIDNLYNITYILRDPVNHGRAYRLSGIKKEQRDLKEDEDRYGGKAEWDEWIRDSKSKIDLNMRGFQVTQAEVDAQAEWMTFGKYLSQ